MTEVILVAVIAAVCGGLRLFTFVHAVRGGEFSDPIGRVYEMFLTGRPNLPSTHARHLKEPTP